MTPERPQLVPRGIAGPVDLALVLSHSTSRVFDLCEPCFAKVVDFIDPKKTWRVQLDEELAARKSR
jgi:hypothetical protein